MRIKKKQNSLPADTERKLMKVDLGMPVTCSKSPQDDPFGKSKHNYQQ